MIRNILTGALKVFLLSLAFPFVTLATCIVAIRLLQSTIFREWATTYGNYLCIGFSSFCFLCALVAFADHGSSGSIGQNSAGDLRDAFIRILLRHIFFSLCFLAPIALVCYMHNVPAYVCLLSLYVIHLMVNPSAHVDSAIVERRANDNLGRFLTRVGSSGRIRTTKRIRRK